MGGGEGSRGCGSRVCIYTIHVYYTRILYIYIHMYTHILYFFEGFILFVHSILTKVTSIVYNNLYMLLRVAYCIVQYACICVITLYNTWCPIVVSDRSFPYYYCHKYDYNLQSSSQVCIGEGSKLNAILKLLIKTSLQCQESGSPAASSLFKVSPTPSAFAKCCGCGSCKFHWRWSDCPRVALGQWDRGRTARHMGESVWLWPPRARFETADWTSGAAAACVYSSSSTRECGMSDTFIQVAPVELVLVSMFLSYVSCVKSYITLLCTVLRSLLPRSTSARANRRVSRRRSSSRWSAKGWKQRARCLGAIAAIPRAPAAPRL